METVFLNAAGTVLFVRSDMEQGRWTQEEYTVTATFPFDKDKQITRGMRIAFRDPATNNLEIFEVRNVNTIEPDHYQDLIAEHIAVAELSDEHCERAEITDKTPAQALGTALTGTLWSVGNSTVSAVSSVDISRGSVWNAVNAIMKNWNAYITPRVTVNAAGSITGRYLDISPAQGTWRGVRLSVDKNITDVSVIFDDTDVITAMYGYGGNVLNAQDQQEELTFANVVWTATQDHPAKPSGQTYLEYPEKTALYGRNGRARFGFYQNGDIKDANILLQKTWEMLKTTCDPKISISGTVTDLYRLGYKDEPIRLHDTVIVEVRDTGETFQKQIIKLDVDLIDPTATKPEIGEYIPNIIYINKETETKASGGGGGGGGGRGQTQNEYETATTYATIVNTENMVGLVVGTRQGEYYIKGGEITLSINEDGGTTAKLAADTIDIEGLVQEFTAMTIGVGVLEVEGNATVKGQSLYAEGAIVAEEKIRSNTGFDPGNNKIYSAKSLTVVTNVGVTMPTISRSSQRYFLYASASGSTVPQNTQTGRVFTGYTAGTVEPTTQTIYYLGADS